MTTFEALIVILLKRPSPSQMKQAIIVELMSLRLLVVIFLIAFIFVSFKDISLRLLIGMKIFDLNVLFFHKSNVL